MWFAAARGWPMTGRVDLNELFPMKPYDPDYSYTPMEWLVEGLWFKGGINGVFGNEKAGKSRLSCWLLAGSLLGNPTLGLKTTKPGRVLYLAGEERYGTIVARMRRYAYLQEGEISPDQLTIIEASGMHMEQGFYRDWLQGLLADHDMLFIDPYRRIHGAQENDNTQMSSLHNDLRRWSNRDKKTIVLEHHSKHTNAEFKEQELERIAGWSRGATDLAAIVDAACYIDRSGLGDTVQVMRDGRFPKVPPLRFVDMGGPDHNPENDRGFRVSAALEKVRG